MLPAASLKAVLAGPLNARNVAYFTLRLSRPSSDLAFAPFDGPSHIAAMPCFVPLRLCEKKTVCAWHRLRSWSRPRAAQRTAHAPHWIHHKGTKPLRSEGLSRTVATGFTPGPGKQNPILAQSPRAALFSSCARRLISHIAGLPCFVAWRLCERKWWAHGIGPTSGPGLELRNA